MFFLTLLCPFHVKLPSDRISQRWKSTDNERFIVMEAISYARPEFQQKAAGHVATATAKT